MTNLNTEEAIQLAQRAKKRRTVIIWLRVIAALFMVLFFLSQCAMSKKQATVNIMESCIQNVPFAPKWQQDLAQNNLIDESGQLVKQYCVCMWQEPLSQLSEQQIQSFAKLSTQEQLQLLGGEEAFITRDKQCFEQLKLKK